MPGQGPPTDVPPAAFGRFRVLHQTGTGSLGPAFRGEDPERREPVTITVLSINLAPAEPQQVADDLKALAAKTPQHSALAPILDAGVQGKRCYVVTPLVPGQSLEAALTEYGPAAIADALPRLRQLAEGLDAAAGKRVWHGMLTPREIMVSPDDTAVLNVGVAPTLERAGVWMPERLPYSAPEIVEGEGSSPTSDQFALAAITCEWLFGQRISGPADTRVEVPALPGVDRYRLASALTTALAPNPRDRFKTTVAFVDAVAACVTEEAIDAAPAAAAIIPDPRVLELANKRTKETVIGTPLLPLDDELLVEVAPADLSLADLDIGETDSTLARPKSPSVGERKVDSDLTLSEFARPEPTFTQPLPPYVRPEAPARDSGVNAAPSFGAVNRETARSFGAAALAGALLIGIAVGSVGGYAIGRSRAAASAPVAPAVTEAPPPKSQDFTDATLASKPTTTDVAASASAPVASSEATVDKSDGPVAPAAPAAPANRTAPIAPDDRTAPVAPAAPRAPVAPRSAARLHVTTSPAGATVIVDGVERGVTPLALRDLDLGTRTVSISRAGYVTAERKVTLTEGRPSRSIEVHLTPLRATKTRPTATPTAAARTTTGSLLIESLPSGAAVSVDGRVAGVTPLTLSALPPGPHTVRIERMGYRPWSTTVRVTAGERARVAASLVGEREDE